MSFVTLLMKVPEVVSLEKPLRAFGHLKKNLQVNAAQLSRGDKLVVSTSLREERGSSTELLLDEIDTSDLDPGEHTVRVSVHYVDLATDESEQFSGVAVVEVLGVTEPA